jgi:small subunit ribosomal protein S6
LRPYEVAVIFDATLDETVVRETTDKIGEFVKSRGGQPGHVDRWGRRQFAYEMNHKTEGNYVFIEVTAEPSVLAELDRMLTLSDDVLRHRVIRQPERVAGRRPAPTVPASKPDSPAGE